MNFDALYQDVLAQPDDDGPRRVLADVLTDEGDPLGDFIRVQCDLADKGPRAPRALRVAEAALLAQHGPAWHNRFVPWATEVAFRRGFPALAWTTVKWLEKHGRDGTLPPTLALVLELERDADGSALLGLPLLERITTLELSRGLTPSNRRWPSHDSFWEPISQARRLTALHLEELHSFSDVQLFLRLPQLASLTELSLRGISIQTPDERQALFNRLALLPQLESLDLTGGQLGEAGQHLERLVQRGALRRLIVDHCQLHAWDLRPLTLATHARARSVVSIGGNLGLYGPWQAGHEVTGSCRQDLEHERAEVNPAPPGRAPLGRIGNWDLVDLVGHRLGTSRWLARSGDTHGLLTWITSSAAALCPGPDDLSLTREALERGARGLVGLGQPNLIRWLDYGLHGTGPFVVHELTDAQQLRVLLGESRQNATPFTAAEVARIGLDLARALIALHHAGQIHGALNETTVFLTPNGTAKLLPLGLETPWFYGAGAYRFLSPEQASGTPPGPASDLFQLGTLLYTLLIGRHPFQQTTDGETIKSILGQGEAPPPLPGRTPPGLRELIERLVAVDPAARPASAEELLMELAMRSNQPITPPVEPPLPPYIDWLARAWQLARVLAIWAPLADRGD